jgi:hypothetical protein
MMTTTIGRLTDSLTVASPAWWRAALPPICRVWFDASLYLIDAPVRPVDPRVADIARLALLSGAIDEAGQVLDATPAHQRYILRRQLRQLVIERNQLAADIGLVFQ